MVMGPEPKQPLSTAVKVGIFIVVTILFIMVLKKGWHPFLKLK